MNIIVILLVVLVLVFDFTIPVTAGGYRPGGGNGSGGTGSGSGHGQQGSRGTFVMVGKIATLGTNTVTIDMIRGSNLVQPYLGTQITVTLTSRMSYLY